MLPLPLDLNPDLQKLSDVDYFNKLKLPFIIRLLQIISVPLQMSKIII